MDVETALTRAQEPGTVSEEANVFEKAIALLPTLPSEAKKPVKSTNVTDIGPKHVIPPESSTKKKSKEANHTETKPDPSKTEGIDSDRPNFWALMEEYFRPLEAEDVGMCLQIDPMFDPSFLVPSFGRHYSAFWAEDFPVDSNSSFYRRGLSQTETRAEPTSSAPRSDAYAQRRAPCRKRSSVRQSQGEVAHNDQEKSLLLRSCPEPELAQIIKQAMALCDLSVEELAVETSLVESELRDWLSDSAEQLNPSASALSPTSLSNNPQHNLSSNSNIAVSVTTWLRSQAVKRTQISHRSEANRRELDAPLMDSVVQTDNQQLPPEEKVPSPADSSNLGFGELDLTSDGKQENSLQNSCVDTLKQETKDFAVEPALNSSWYQTPALWRSNSSSSPSRLLSSLPFKTVGLALATRNVASENELKEPSRDEFLHPYVQTGMSRVFPLCNDTSTNNWENGIIALEPPKDSQNKTQSAVDDSENEATRQEPADVTNEAPNILSERQGKSTADKSSSNLFSFPFSRLETPRCQVCIVQKKGKCGTTLASPRCLRRPSSGDLKLKSENLRGSSGSLDESVSQDQIPCGTLEQELEKIERADVSALLAISPSDEVTAELLHTQWELLQTLGQLRKRQTRLLTNIVEEIPNDSARLKQKGKEAEEVELYMGKQRELRRALKKERRERELAAQAAAAHAAAAASSRSSHVKREGGAVPGTPGSSALCGPMDAEPALMDAVQASTGDFGHKGKTSKGQGSSAAKTLPPMPSLTEDEETSSDEDLLVDHSIEAYNEDEAVCIVCGNGDSEVPNEIVNCERCGLWVHQRCYSIKQIPEGEWHCWPCKAHLDSEAVRCHLCPVRRGAFKRSTNGKWIHLVCAYWMPQIEVIDEDTDITIDGVEGICNDRWKLVCGVCNRKEGTCIQCSHGSCTAAFHPLCARTAGYFMIMRDPQSGAANFRVYCEKHSQMHRGRQKERVKVEKDPTALHPIPYVRKPQGRPPSVNKQPSLDVMQHELERLRRLRVDFERLRLLCERMVKRERLKAELSQTQCALAKANTLQEVSQQYADSNLDTPAASSSRHDTAGPSTAGPRSGSLSTDQPQPIPVRGHRSGGRRGHGTAPFESSGHPSEVVVPKRPRLNIDKSESRVKVDREVLMTSGEAEVTNSRLPKGYVYVPLDAFTNNRDRSRS